MADNLSSAGSVSTAARPLRLDTLTPEIILLILQHWHLNQRDHAYVSRTSKTLHAIANPILYRNVTLLKETQAASLILSHGLKEPPSGPTVLQNTVSLMLGGINSLKLQSLLRACGPSLQIIMLNCKCLLEEEQCDVARSLAPHVGLRDLRLASATERSLRVWLNGRSSLERLYVTGLSCSSDLGALDSSTLQDIRLRTLAVSNSRSETARCIIEQLLRLSADTLEEISYGTLGPWVPEIWLPTFSALKDLSLSFVPCGVVPGILQNTPSLLSLELSLRHESPSTTGTAEVTSCDEAIFASLPSLLQNLQLLGVLEERHSAASLETCLERLDQLKQLPAIRYWGGSSTVLPHSDTRKKMLRHMAKRGLVWSDAAERKFITRMSGSAFR